MATCTIPNREELDNLVDNKKAIFNVKSDQTAEQTVEHLNFLQDNFQKVDGVYATKTGKSLKTTVTTEVSKWYEKQFPVPLSSKAREKVNQQAAIGNTIHSLIEFTLKDLITELDGKFAKDALSVLDSADLYDKYKDRIARYTKQVSDTWGYKLGPQVGEKIFKGVITNLRQVYNRQNALDLRTGTKGILTIRSEQIVVDPKKDMGGTADFVAIFSNNTAMVLDFKTKVIPDYKLNPNGTIKHDAKIISTIDEKRYSMQLASLSKILRQSIGVKTIMAARIEPIRINIKYNKDTGKFSDTITDIAYGYAQDNKLQQIAPLSESTGFADLDAFIRDLEKRLRQLNRSAKDVKDKEEKSKMLDRIKELETAKRDILVFHNFDKLLAYAQKIESDLTSDAIDKMSVAEIRGILAELKTIQTLSESTWKYREYMKENKIAPEKIAKFEGTIGATIAAVVDKIAVLEEELYNKKIADMIEELSNRKIRDAEGNILAFNDEGYFGKLFNRLSEFENPVFIAFRKKLDSIQYDTRESVKKVIKDVQKNETALFKWMEQTGKDRAWFVKTFIDTKTDNFHNKLDQKFRSELKEVYDEGDVSKIVEYYQPRENWKDWFNERLSKIENEAERNTFISNFDLSLDGKGKAKQPSAWLNALKKFHTLQIKPEVENNNLSAEYKYIQSIPEVKAYYDMFMEYNKHFRDILDLEYFNLPNNFIPNIRRDTLERIRDYGVIEGTKQSIRDMIDNLNIREDDTFVGELEDGQLTRRIPRFFVNPFKDAEGNVKIGEKSYELGKSLVLFAKMAYNYEYMQKEEANILAMREFLSERGQELIRRKGKVLEDYVGNKLARSLQNTDLEKVFNTFVDMYLYGIQIQPAFGDESMVWEKRILEAKQYMTLKSLGLNFIASAGSVAAAKINAVIEGNKGVIYTKDHYNKALKESWGDRKKHLALVAFFDAMNVEYENFSVTEHELGKKHHIADPSRRGVVEKYVNARLLMRPFSYGDEWIDELITNAMAKNYYVDDNGSLRRFKNSEEETKYADRSIWNLFNYEGNEAKLNLPEEQVKNVIIEFRNAARAGQARIKGTIPHEDKAYWQSQILGQVVMHYKSWMPAIIKERFGGVKFNESLKAVELGKYTALGKEFTNIEGYAMYDFATKIVLPKLKDFGLHLATFGKIKMNDKFRKQEAFEQWLEDNPQYKDIIDFEEFLDIQQKQLKSLMVELRIILAFMAIAALLGFDWDDDGQKDYKQLWATRKLAAILFKTNQELTFTYNPVEFAKMVANPIPMISLVTDAWKTIGNTMDETRDLLLGENSKNDKTGFLYYGHQWVPGLRGTIKLLDVFNKDSGDAYR